MPRWPWILMSLSCSVSCESSQSRDVLQEDGAIREEAQADAGQVPTPSGEPALASLVAAMLTEYGREVAVTCPCRVEERQFSSVAECSQAMGGDTATWVDCAIRAFAPTDSPELRAALRCRVEDSQARTECLAAHSCDHDERNGCYAQTKDCPVVDAQALTVVVYSCIGSFGLSK